MVRISGNTYSQNFPTALDTFCSQITCCCTIFVTACRSKRMGRNAGFILCVTISGSNSKESTNMQDSKSSSAVISSIISCSCWKDLFFTTARTRVLVGRAAAHRSYMVHGRKACMQASRATLGKFALLCKHAEVGHRYAAGNTDLTSSGRQAREYDAEITVYW